MICPNKNLPEWKKLVDNLGEEQAYKIFIANGDIVPLASEVEKILEHYGKKDNNLSLATNEEIKLNEQSEDEFGEYVPLTDEEIDAKFKNYNKITKADKKSYNTVKSDAPISYNSNNEILAPNGNVSKLYKDIESLEGVASKEQAIQLYKQTRSKEFKEWFGDSKVVDENGEPLIVYHNSQNIFDTFKKEGINQIAEDMELPAETIGIFFTPTKEEAKPYGSISYPSFLRINNLKEQDFIDYNTYDLYNQATKEGYDGILDKASHGEGQYLVFEPNQIKSVFNQGTFSKESDNINLSLATNNPIEQQEYQLKLRNDDGSRKRFVINDKNYAKLLTRVKELNAQGLKARIIKVSGEKSDRRVYYAISLLETANIEPKVEVKKGVVELFNSNSELAKIGTHSQYSRYLDTIFPNSKVDEIVYHNTKAPLDKILSEGFKEPKNFVGYWFHNNITYKGFGDTQVPAKINVTNVFGNDKNLPESVILENNEFEQELAMASYGTPDAIEEVYAKYGDSPIRKFQRELIKEGKYDSYGGFDVYSQKQIHILGSKEDIKGFKEFVSNDKKQSPYTISTETSSEIAKKNEQLGKVDRGILVQSDTMNFTLATNDPDKISAKIEEILKNSEFIKLSEDGKNYINTKTGAVYKRVSDFISDTEVENNALLTSASTIGTKVDVLVRDFFSNTLKPLDDYEIGFIDDVKAFVKQLEKLKQDLDKRGETVVSKDIVLYSDELKVAGTIDLLTYDKNGVFRIYDMKTMRGNNLIDEGFGPKYDSTAVFEKTGELKPNGEPKYRVVKGKTQDSKRTKHTKQLSVYRILLNNTHGVKAEELKIIAIEVDYLAGQTTTSKLDLLQVVPLKPMDKVKVAEIIEQGTSNKVAELQESNYAEVEEEDMSENFIPFEDDEEPFDYGFDVDEDFDYAEEGSYEMVYRRKLKEELTEIEYDFMVRLRDRMYSMIRAKSKASQILASAITEEEKTAQLTKIANIDNNISKVKTELKDLLEKGTYDYMLDVAQAHLTIIEKELKESKNLDDTTLLDILKELDMWTVLTDSFSKREGDKFAIENDAVRKRAAELSGRALEFKNMWSEIVKDTLINAGDDKKLVQKLTRESLSRFKETGILTATFLDLHHNQNTLAQLIDLWLRDAGGASITEYENEIGIPLKDLLKEAKSNGIDLLSKEEQDKFIQLDEKGNRTLHLVDEYTFEWYYMLRNAIKDLKEFNWNRSKANYNRYIKAVGNIVGNGTVIDPYRLFNLSYDENTGSLVESTHNKSQYIDSLVSELGQERTERAITEAKRIVEAFIEDFNKMREEIQATSENEEDFTNRMKQWFLMYSPFAAYTQMTGTIIEGRNIIVEGYNKLVVVPKENEMNWYDQKYKALKEDTLRFSYYTRYRELMDSALKEIPSFMREKLSPNYLAEIEQGMLEAIMNETGGLKEKFDKTIQKFQESASEKENRAVTSAEIDKYGKPIKSIPIRYVGNTYSRLMDKLGKLEDDLREMKSRMSSLRIALSKFDELPKMTDEDENNKKLVVDMIDQLSDKMAENSELKEATLKELDNVRSNSSTDIVKILQMFGMMAMNYKHKSRVEDIVLLGRKIMDDSVEAHLTIKGQNVSNLDGKHIYFKNGLIRTKAHVDNTIDALLYGRYKKGNIPLGITVYTDPDDKKKAKELDKAKKEAYKKYKNGEITLAEYETELDVIKVKKEQLSSTRIVTLDNVVDKLLSYTQLKGIGYSPLSAFVNLVYGKLTNTMYARKGDLYNEEDLSKASIVMRSALSKAAGLGVNETAEKIRNVMNKYNILFNMNEAAYGGSGAVDEKYKKFGLAIPYEFQKRSEYYIQGQAMVAMMLNTKVQTINGEEISLWEAYDKNGNMQEGIANSEEWETLISAKESNSFTQTRNKITGRIQEMHGNYNPNSPIIVKAYALGRLVMQFKSWLPEGFNQRLGAEHTDELTGRVVKGRWVTYRDIYKRGGVKEILDVLYKIALKRDVSNYISQTDIENMRVNIAELQLIIGLSVTYILSSIALSKMDDDDEKEWYERIGYMLLNRLGRINSDMSFYASPAQLQGVINNPIPAIRTMNDFAKILPAVKNFLWSGVSEDRRDDSYYDGMYLTNRLLTPFPIVNEIPKTYKQADKIID